MTIHPEDPRLTAYVLGELEEPERAAVEAALAEDGAARRAVEEIRAAARLLEEELKKEAAPALTESQRRRIEQRARPASHRRLRWLAAAAAVVCMLMILGALLVPSLQKASEHSHRRYSKIAFPAADRSPPAQTTILTSFRGAVTARPLSFGSVSRTDSFWYRAYNTVFVTPPWLAAIIRIF